MFLISVCLIVVGVIIGFISIYKATHSNNLEDSLGWLFYLGLFIAMIGASLVGISL